MVFGVVVRTAKFAIANNSQFLCLPIYLDTPYVSGNMPLNIICRENQKAYALKDIDIQPHGNIQILSQQRLLVLLKKRTNVLFRTLTPDISYGPNDA